MTVVNGHAKQPWQDVVAKKRAEQAARLAPFIAASGLDKGSSDDKISSSENDEGQDVTAISSASRLVDLIDRGDVTSVAVTKAYIKRFVPISSLSTHNV